MNKFLWAAFMVAGLALAGCGGSSNNETTEEGGMMPPPAPAPVQCGGGITATPPETCTQATRKADQAAADAAKARTDAVGIYNALTATVTVGGITDDTMFKAAKGEKNSQKLTVQGAKFTEDTVDKGTKVATAAPGQPKDSYPIGDNNALNSLDRGDAAASVFAPGPTQTDHTLDGDVFQTTGTWKGVAGTFYCTTGCNSQNGNPQGANWHFLPTSEDVRVAGDDATWGWWIVNVDDKPANARAFFDAGGLTPSTDYTGLTGTATYEGNATGKYAVSGEAGHFTAKATLTAKFGTADTLSGKVDAFKDADGNDKTGWSVELKGAVATADAAEITFSSTVNDVALNDATPVTASVWTRDGVKGTPLANAWTADLFGGSATKAPTHALGTFEAQHQGSHMIGAFGTAKTSEAAE